MGLKGSMLLMSKASDSDSAKIVGETSGVAKVIRDSILEGTKDVWKSGFRGFTSSVTTIRTWTRKRDDGTQETVTETKKDFTIKPSKSGAKLGAIAGGIAGWIFGPA